MGGNLTEKQKPQVDKEFVVLKRYLEFQVIKVVRLVMHEINGIRSRKLQVKAFMQYCRNFKNPEGNFISTCII